LDVQVILTNYLDCVRGGIPAIAQLAESDEVRLSYWPELAKAGSRIVHPMAARMCLKIGRIHRLYAFADDEFRRGIATSVLTNGAEAVEKLGSACARPLCACIEDSSPSVRSIGAFLLGMEGIADSDSISRLAAAFAKETTFPTNIAMAAALLSHRDAAPADAISEARISLGHWADANIVGWRGATLNRGLTEESALVSILQDSFSALLLSQATREIAQDSSAALLLARATDEIAGDS
jgi:hypothetical protein